MGPTTAGTRPDPVTVALATVADSRKSGVILVGPVGSGKTSSLRSIVRAIGSSQNLGRRQVVVASRSPSRRESWGHASVVEGAWHRGTQPRHRGRRRSRHLGSQALHLLADALDRRQIQLVGTVRTGGVQRVLRNLRPSPAPMLLTLEPWSVAEAVRPRRPRPRRSAGRDDQCRARRATPGETRCVSSASSSRAARPACCAAGTKPGRHWSYGSPAGDVRSGVERAVSRSHPASSTWSSRWRWCAGCR